MHGVVCHHGVCRVQVTHGSLIFFFKCSSTFLLPISCLDAIICSCEMQLIEADQGNLIVVLVVCTVAVKGQSHCWTKGGSSPLCFFLCEKPR